MNHNRLLSVTGCCFVTFYTRKAALAAQNALHNVKTFSGVSELLAIDLSVFVCEYIVGSAIRVKDPRHLTHTITDTPRMSTRNSFIAMIIL